ncbi:MAG: carbamoyltransferase HypF [Bacteroidales bacterium]|nr:carbamoyltransferase HypF [Bacteroidales bacterium]
MKFKFTKIKKSVLISIEGLVQGVGFRPFVYRLANKYKLKGNVANRTDGVIINLYGEEKLIESFKIDIKKLAPPAAFVKNIISENTKSEFVDFKILTSEVNEQITEISPDIAVCDDCLEDLNSQNHRVNYPFINCTNCGPRFTIVNKIPYDRINTSMSEFEMCEICNEEYHNVLDRRFHAQPVACNNCGPTYLLNDECNFENILDELVAKIDKGKLLAVKGLGGYNIICDAKNNSAVLRAREIKGRDGKPFAVMFKDLNAVQEYCKLNLKEEEILKSWQKPIVILEQKKDLAQSVNTGLNSIGAMLPYLPFHYLMFEKLKTNAIVYTSANNSGNPIISDDDFAKNVLENKVNLFVSHNREIENPLDDSVVKLVSDDIQIIRRARGFVPKQVYLNRTVEGIFGTGAELKNSFCIGKNSSAILSQYIGDLKNLETFNFYEQTANRLFDLFKFKPKVIACDMHPEYFSTQFAEKLNANNINGSKISILKVQHHHAHIASCLAENQIDEKVIGISFDGTGYGNDGNIWGGEFLICDTKSFERFAHFDYVKMPGGDLAVNEPWRMLLSYLKNYNINKIDSLKCFDGVDGEAYGLVSKMLQNNINSPLTSSAGRLFDAVACLLNLCAEQSFDAEAPMRLETILDKSEIGFYPYIYNNSIVSFSETINSVINDLNTIDVSRISAKFHNTIAQIIFDVAKRINKETSIKKVILSGGVFQNKYLLEKSIHNLNKNNFEVYTNRLVPPNDGGIALGQLVVASNFL